MFGEWFPIYDLASYHTGSRCLTTSKFHIKQFAFVATFTFTQIHISQAEVLASMIIAFYDHAAYLTGPIQVSAKGKKQSI